MILACPTHYKIRARNANSSKRSIRVVAAPREQGTSKMVRLYARFG